MARGEQPVYTGSPGDPAYRRFLRGPVQGHRRGYPGARLKTVCDRGRGEEQRARRKSAKEELVTYTAINRNMQRDYA